jgi:uncharacterized glyoxalase superfamily protein PhnB
MAQTITPYLLYADGEGAIDFLTRAFGFTAVEKATGEAGGLHAELVLEPGDGRLYLGQPPAGYRNPSEAGATSLLYVLVDDVDRHFTRARDAGATITEELHDLDYGHRRYSCDDPQGHQWTFAQELRDA